MESIRVNRSELVGKSQNNTAVLESLVGANALNRTGNVDYNENGKLAKTAHYLLGEVVMEENPDDPEFTFTPYSLLPVTVLFPLKEKVLLAPK